MADRDRILQKVMILLENSANRSSSNGSRGQNTMSQDEDEIRKNEVGMDWDTLNDMIHDDDHFSWSKTAIISIYSIIVVVSLFGNSLVCRLVYKDHQLKKTFVNIFIANMAISDLLMTILNIPFTLARIFLENWPFGLVICALVPSVQVTSVYVSTFTMTCIALDRHQAIMSPLKPRLFKRGGKRGIVALIFIWIISSILSIPHAIFNNVVDNYSYRKMIRCNSEYPTNDHRRWITLFTTLTQYVCPLLLTSVGYTRLVHKLWYRTVLGAVTEDQARSRNQSKKKTIAMLIVVVAVFAFCWLPLNLYHLISDFSLVQNPWTYNSSTFLACHVLAMSSVCYNPFIYCSLNERFNRGAQQALKCLHNPCRGHGSRESESNRNTFQMSGTDLSTKSFNLRSSVRFTSKGAADQKSVNNDESTSGKVQRINATDSSESDCV